MAVGETLLAQGAKLLNMACRCGKSEMADTLRDMARQYIALAHKQAGVCVERPLSGVTGAQGRARGSLNRA